MVVLALSGCSDAPAAAPADEGAQDFEDFDLEDTKQELGVIRGVVLDAAIVPVAGAAVRLMSTGQNATTNDNGAFAFKDVEPGTHFVKAGRLGFAETQTSVEVTAGLKEPPVLKIMLERVPGMEPSIVPLQFDGHITCSARIPSGFATGCLLSIAVGDLGGDRMDFDVPEGNVHWMQTELTWEGNLDTARGLCLRVYGYGTSDVCGESPVVQAINQEAAQANGLGRGEPIEVVTYADFFVEPVFGLALEQDFQAFTHAFYNFVPPEDWQFGRDGEPPIPA